METAEAAEGLLPTHAQNGCTWAFSETVRTPSLWFRHFNQVLGTDRRHRHSLAQAKEALLNLPLKHQMGRTIGPQDARHRAALAQIGLPRVRMAVLRNEATLLPLPAPKVIFVVVTAFRASRGYAPAGVIIIYLSNRIKSNPKAVSSRRRLRALPRPCRLAIAASPETSSAAEPGGR
jgi:hypothetical protein